MFLLMLAMLPADFSLPHLLAMSLLLLSWFSYPVIFKIMGKETINSKLLSVRRQWLKQVTEQGRSPFDSILIGHIVHSVAFFGSATLIVIAGLFSIVMNLDSIHSTMTGLYFIDSISIELFTINFSLLALVLTISFFAFVYALRKLVYSIALIGALPVSEGADMDANNNLNILIEATTMVITESLKTFNFGIRGYYYAIAAIFLFVSPLMCILATLFVTGVLIYRQMHTSTAHAISNYVNVR
jgi:uncharacterized membrane protein